MLSGTDSRTMWRDTLIKALSLFDKAFFMTVSLMSLNGLT